MNDAANLPEPVINNPKSISLYLVVVVALSALGLATVIGGIILAFVGRALPEAVTVLGSVAVGALAGMVAPTPSAR